MSKPDMLAEALAAHHAGLAVRPPRQDGTKRPDGQWKQGQAERPTEATIRDWYSNGRTGLGLICGSISGQLEMLELDHPAAGMDRKQTWKAFVERCAEYGRAELLDRIIAGYAETTPGGGIHLLYRCEGPVEGNTKLARRPAEGDKVDVIFETRGEGGFVVVAPSYGTVHPSGKPWVRKSGGWDTIATITADERIDLLLIARTFDEMPENETREEPKPLPDSQAQSHLPKRHQDNTESWFDATVAAFNAGTTWDQVLGSRGWQHAGKQGNVDLWTRPGKAVRDGHSATVNANGTDRFILWSSSVHIPGIDTATGPSASSYDRFSVWAGYEHHGNRLQAAEAARKAGYGPEWTERTPVDLDALLGRTGANPVPLVDRDDLHLPADWWDARPALATIRDAARSRLVAPDAVLGGILARVAASVPHTVELPPTIGAAVGLTFYAGLVGPPEVGKSAAAAVAAELLPAPDKVLDRLPIGSGEGMVEVLFELVDEENEQGKAVKVKRQTRHAAIFHVDEGAILADLAGRQGSTLMPTLRTAYTHGTLGNANASIERRRIVEGHLYVYGVTIGIQPELAGPLLADTAGGTPQRFVWLMASDPHAGEGGAWPDRPLWQPPTVADLEPIVITNPAGWRRHRLDVHPTIATEVKMHRIAVMRGDITPDPADAHRTLVRLKVAALLALLDDRVAVRLDDWELAETVVDTSRRIRYAVEATLGDVEEAKQAARIERHIRAEEAAESARRAVPAKEAAIAARVARWVHEQEPCDGFSRRVLGQRCNGVDRRTYLDGAIAFATTQGWLIEVGDDLYQPGESRPV